MEDKARSFTLLLAHERYLLKAPTTFFYNFEVFLNFKFNRERIYLTLELNMNPAAEFIHILSRVCIPSFT